MKDLLIVDGYNVIHAWPELKKTYSESMEHARDQLIDIISNYGKFKGIKVIIVFDAMYTVADANSYTMGDDCEIIFTAKGETADTYIERLAYIQKDKRRIVYVATSDGFEQQQILSTGAYRLSSRELHGEIKQMKKEMDHYKHTPGSISPIQGSFNELKENVRNKVVLDKLEQLRRQK